MFRNYGEPFSLVSVGIFAGGSAIAAGTAGVVAARRKAKAKAKAKARRRRARARKRKRAAAAAAAARKDARSGRWRAIAQNVAAHEAERHKNRKAWREPQKRAARPTRSILTSATSRRRAALMKLAMAKAIAKRKRKAATHHGGTVRRMSNFRTPSLRQSVRRKSYWKPM